MLMKYYCIGIKGSGMSTLAQMLKDLGNEVYGYDDEKEEKFTQKGLEERKIPIFYDDSFPLTKEVIVTSSVAVAETHKERVRAAQSEATYQSYHTILGNITKQFKTYAVCGTHGKTTTTSLLTHLLEKKNSCNYFIGDGRGKIDRKKDLLVIEADEFNRHFLSYETQVSLVTCIELEHTEIYQNLEDMINTFSTFLNQNTKEKVIAFGDDENIRKISFQKPVLFYGEKENNLYQIRDILLDEKGSSFTLFKEGEKIDSFYVPLYGKHMVYNATAAILAALELGLTSLEIKEQLNTFINAKRRMQETIINGHIFLDDYAHHPTEIKATIQAIRQKYPKKRVVVVFRPNTYSRTKAFYKEFQEALSLADQAYVTPILCDREDPKEYENVTSELILKGLKNGKLLTEETIDILQKEIDSVVAFMGCASLSHLIEKYKTLLK